MYVSMPIQPVSFHICACVIVRVYMCVCPFHTSLCLCVRMPILQVSFHVTYVRLFCTRHHTHVCERKTVCACVWWVGVYVCVGGGGGRWVMRKTGREREERSIGGEEGEGSVCQITHMNEFWHAYEWVESHIWISHVTHMNHIWMSHVTHMNESCHTYEWAMLHIWMSHVTPTNQSCHAYESVMSHI